MTVKHDATGVFFRSVVMETRLDQTRTLVATVEIKSEQIRVFKDLHVSFQSVFS